MPSWFGSRSSAAYSRRKRPFSSQYGSTPSEPLSPFSAQPRSVRSFRHPLQRTSAKQPKSVPLVFPSHPNSAMAPPPRSLHVRPPPRQHRLSDENAADRQPFRPYPMSIGSGPRSAESGHFSQRSSMDARQQMFPDDPPPSLTRAPASAPVIARPTPQHPNPASPPVMMPQQRVRKRSDLRPSLSQAHSLPPMSSQNQPVPLTKWMTPAIVEAGYIVTNLINEGTFGTVLKAMRVSDRMTVAIKVVKKARLSEKETIAIRNHPITLRSLHHRYIVRFLHDFEDLHFFYHVFEHLGGGDLYDRLQSRGKPFSEPQVLFLARQLFYALSYLHSKRCAHRDIKLENLVFETLPTDQRQVIKLIDFDLLVVRGRHASSLDTCSDVCGTILYVSPEIASASHHVPEQSDMWACGVMLYVLLSYQMPFQGSSRQILRAVRTQDPPFSPHIWGSISPQTRQLVKDLLSKNAANRPTAEQALERVKAIQGGSRTTHSVGRLRAITRGLRSVSLNLWDPSGNLNRRSRPERLKERKEKDQQLRPVSSHRRVRPPRAMPKEDDSTASATSSVRSSFVLHSQVGSDINSDRDGSASPPSRQPHIMQQQQKQSVSPSAREVERGAPRSNARGLSLSQKPRQFELNEFLTSPALGGALTSTPPKNTSYRTKPDISNVTSESETVARNSRRLRKQGLGSKIRSWMNFSSFGGSESSKQSQR